MNHSDVLRIGRPPAAPRKPRVRPIINRVAQIVEQTTLLLLLAAIAALY